MRILFCFFFLLTSAQARDFVGRMGVGVTNQLINDLPAISFKLQRSQSLAIGAVLGTKINDTSGGAGYGFKAYRIIFDEPQLNFYGAVLAAYLKEKVNSISESGFQVDLTFGSEFNFTGLESLGFSFEMGLSINDLSEDLTIETVGNHFITAALHFYI